MISENDMSSRSRWTCLSYPWPHLYIIGGQLSALIVLVIGVERVPAVYKPMEFRKIMTTRFIMLLGVGYISLAVSSLIVGYVFNFLDRNTCTVATCMIPNTFGTIYSDYNYAIVSIFPVVAVIFNSISYSGAKRLSYSNSSTSNFQNELKKIRAVLVITAGSVILTSIPSLFMIGYHSWWSLPTNVVAYLNIGLCANSIVNLVVYVVFKPLFRNQLVSIFTCGMGNRCLKNPSNVAGNQLNKISPVIEVLRKIR
jgi:hypothetical protein